MKIVNMVQKLMQMKKKKMMIINKDSNLIKKLISNILMMKVQMINMKVDKKMKKILILSFSLLLMLEKRWKIKLINTK